jgi:hypothetical protein
MMVKFTKLNLLGIFLVMLKAINSTDDINDGTKGGLGIAESRYYFYLRDDFLRYDVPKKDDKESDEDHYKRQKGIREKKLSDAATKESLTEIAKD